MSICICRLLCWHPPHVLKQDLDGFKKGPGLVKRQLEENKGK